MPSAALLALLLALAVFLGFLSLQLPDSPKRVGLVVATILAGVVVLVDLLTLLG